MLLSYLIFSLIIYLAVLIILVHSFYSWEGARKENHLIASFDQFIRSSHSEVVTSAVKQAIESCGEDYHSLCNEIINIVWKHPLEHPALTKTSLTNTEPIITAGRLDSTPRYFQILIHIG
ncbi:hypothetical protein JVT61DRAFT_8504 [Boletus reticuloceps]|uniref:Uncharacterized protein n=1 Tax=Boletus reticuloceps TaxID=495285 RepID=A0A8I2Z0E4_9AGAM|nr:hypothetical protein JVT61DRAFT_8504 [Boletus reticuloceps]